MRIMPIVTAIIVMTVLYLFVFERDALLGFAGADEDTAVDETVVEAETMSPEPVAPEGERRVSVVAIDSTAQIVDSAVVLRGRTEALRQVSVLAETSGRIISEPLRRGAEVEENQVMCVLDPGNREANLAEAEARLFEARARIPEARARVAEAEARLEEAKINDNAARNLAAEGFATETRVANSEANVRSAESAVSTAKTGLESVRAGIQSAEAAVFRAQKALEHLTVRAPFAGVLEDDTAEFGSYLNTQGGNSTCGTILQLDPIKLVGFVPETDVALVEVGARAGAKLATGREVTGRVTFLSRSADLTTRTFRAEVEVANPDLLIRDGQTATIGIAAEGTPAHLLPASALTLNDEGALGVRHAVEDGQGGYVTAFAAVELIRDTAEGVWVTGLPDQANVVVVGQDYITAGTALTLTFREEGA